MEPWPGWRPLADLDRTHREDKDGRKSRGCESGLEPATLRFTDDAVPTELKVVDPPLCCDDFVLSRTILRFSATIDNRQ